MSEQEQAFIEGLGDDWFLRNKTTLETRTKDTTLDLVRATGFLPNSILEIGCANGWRLKKLREMTGCQIAGVDPSKEAIAAAGESTFQVGVATALPFPNQSFDCVIMGFCMYHIDPQDWFTVVSESDRVLKDGGSLIVYDRFAARPIKKPWLNHGGVYVYGYDWPRLWLSHPFYSWHAEVVGAYPGTFTVEGSVMLVKNIEGNLIVMADENKS